MNNPAPVVPVQQLTDWACIDLIQRNRSAENARVEDYLDKHPELREPVCLLDLIDAEICIRKELGEELDEAQWVNRFPQLEKEVRQLLHLDETPRVKGSASGSATASTTSSVRSRSAEASFVVGPVTDADTTFITPMPLPPGFVADCLVAKRAGYDLVRCHDTSDGRHFAFKVVDTLQLGAARVSPAQRTMLLNAYEQSARIKHPAWLAPIVATCDEQCLGIMRPWIHGTGWSTTIPTVASSQSLRMVAEVAFCLQAAHDVGGYHGNVCANNLFIDHSGRLLLSDAMSTVAVSDSAEQVRRADELAVLNLLTTLLLDSKRELPLELLVQAQRVLESVQEDRFAILGEWLVRIADAEAFPRPPRSIRRRTADGIAAGLRFFKTFLGRRCGDDSLPNPSDPR